MSEAPKVMWVWPDFGGREWYSAGASDEVNLGLLGKQADLQTKYHHDDTVVALQAQVARLEAALVQCKENAVGAMMPCSVIHAICDEALKETTP